MLVSFLLLRVIFSIGINLHDVKEIDGFIPTTGLKQRLLEVSTGYYQIRSEFYQTLVKDNDELTERNQEYPMASSTDFQKATKDVTIEYSVNFHRHIVKHRNSSGWFVIESFWWLDEAIHKYPEATLLPIPNFTYMDETNVNYGIVAGDIANKSQSYPRSMIKRGFSNDDKNKSLNFEQVQDVLQNILKWYPSQVENLLARWPRLRDFPADVLEERVQFLLASLPDEEILAKVNLTEDIDWPKLYYNSPSGVRCGAGMSVTQVSHALQVLPDPFLLRLNLFPDENEARDSDGNINIYPEKFVKLYEQTPSVVVQMTHSVLDLWVSGVESYDSITLAYLHWRGWEWRECRVMLHSFPSLLPCRLEPSWELYERSGSNSGRISTGIRKQLISGALGYLQMRLQLRPWHIQAMLKTHPRLSGYSASMIQRNVDSLQAKLSLNSAAVRSLILLMPSLLGVSSEALDSRIDFWLIEVGLTLSQLQTAIAQKPALLQYSVENNLRTKIDFFVDTLSIEKCLLARITCRNPTAWGRSFDRYLRPTAESFCEYFEDMTFAEYGQVVVQVPEILRCNWSGNLREKVCFLENRLGLSKKEIKVMVLASPRILLQAISTSLEPKIGILEAYDRHGVRGAIQKNPSLLLNSKSGLQNRIQRLEAYTSEEDTLADALTRSSSSKNYRRCKGVILLSDSVNLEFESVSAAALHAGISVSNMYHILRNGRFLDGKSYVYANTTTSPENNAADQYISSPISQKKKSFEQDIKVKYHLEHDIATSYLTIEVAGCAFPPEDTVRGRRRAGGMALQIGTWTELEWRQSCSQLWKGWRVRLLSDGPVIILGYPYTRPSRPRCNLYACREALRVAREWLATISTKKAHVTIISESSYVIGLLQNSTLVSDWGCAKSSSDLDCTGLGNRHEANPDILYPLSISFNHLTKQRNVPIDSRRNVIVTFKHAVLDENFRRVRDGAQLAAKLMYDSVR